MKTQLHRIASVIALSGAMIASVSAAHLSANLQISTKMTGNNEVPAVTTNAVGIATMTLNEDRDSLCINIGVTKMSGPVMGIHIHRGAVGMNGPVVVNLTPFVNGDLIQTVITGTDLSDTLIANLLSGAYYLNVHTTANPSGEIRGQLSLETDWNFTSDLDGAQENPPVATAAFGLGNFNLAHHKQELKFRVVLNGLSGPIMGAHLHAAGSGTNGGVVEDLTAFISGNVISGTISPLASTVDSLLAGSIYLNVHTAANPNGEIRGQLVVTKAVAMDVALNGAQEVPAVITIGEGAASLKLNYMMDSLWVDVVTSGLTGAIMGIHLHGATAGNNGPVLVDLTSGINGDRVTTTVTGADLTDDLIHDMLAGGIYLNVHTTLNMNGEIRGQVYRLAREAYAATLSGSDQVPAVASNGSGTALVSMDRDQTNLHVMIVASGLSGSLTGAHFHSNVAGQNGGVIYNLTPWFDGLGTDDAAFGYWKSNDATMPFTGMNSVQFRNDSVYINTHTVMNPNGEMRGQVIRGSECEDFTTGISPVAESPGLTVYPNPANDVLNIRVDQTKAGTTIKLFDVSGKVVLADFITSNNHQINIRDLNEGVYFVQLAGENLNIVEKLIIQ